MRDTSTSTEQKARSNTLSRRDMYEPCIHVCPQCGKCENCCFGHASITPVDEVTRSVFFMVVLRLPASITPEKAQRELGTCISFGKPQIAIL
jgi:hypothetical protein